MASNAEEVTRQSPTPSAGEAGSDMRTVARQIEGLLDDDGHYNPSPEQVSRGHPDYDESTDDRAQTPERDDRGRFKKAAAAEDTGDDTAGPDDDETLDIPAAGDDSDADTAGGDTDEDLAASATDDAKTDDGETGAIETLQEFADALEMSLDDFKVAVTHTFNAADEEVTVTLQELEKGYQKDADYRRSTAKLANDRQLAEQEFYERQQNYESQNHFLAAQLQMAEQIVAAELNDPRLTELRESDPAEWTARRDEIGQRLGGLRNARIQAAQAYEQFSYTNKAQLRAREEAALLESIPDFGKSHRATARDLMSTLGYSPAEISEVFDHRVVEAALELSELRTEVAELRLLKEQAGDTVKRVKKDIPRLTKPGKQRGKPRVQRDNVARLRDKARKSGRIEDAARVIETML